MSANERMTESSTGAMKAENDERYDLIPTEPLRLLARHYGVGSRKYAERNWEKGIEWHKNYAAAQRHLNQFWAGEDIDKPTGTPHVISAAWHCFALAEYMNTHPGLDDRPSTIARRNRGGIVIDPTINPLIPNITITPKQPYTVINNNKGSYDLDDERLQAGKWLQ